MPSLNNDLQKLIRRVDAANQAPLTDENRAVFEEALRDLGMFVWMHSDSILTKNQAVILHAAPKGPKPHRRSFSVEEVKAIYKRIRNGESTYSIAQDLHTYPATIYNLRDRKDWPGRE